jgi:hypothetical protein
MFTCAFEDVKDTTIQLQPAIQPYCPYAIICFCISPHIGTELSMISFYSWAEKDEFQMLGVKRKSVKKE